MNIGYKFFPETHIPDLCAAACTSTSRYNREHPAADGSYQECKFFVAYTAHEDGVPQGLYCALYSKEHDLSYATNYGENRSGSQISLTDGFGYVREPICTTAPVKTKTITPTPRTTSKTTKTLTLPPTTSKTTKTLTLPPTTSKTTKTLTLPPTTC